MELGTAILQQGLAFLFTFTVTLVVISEPDALAEERSIWDRLQNLVATIRSKTKPSDEKPQPLGRLSDETWQRVLRFHMINTAPYQRM